MERADDAGNKQLAQRRWYCVLKELLARALLCVRSAVGKADTEGVHLHPVVTPKPTVTLVPEYKRQSTPRAGLRCRIWAGRTSRYSSTMNGTFSLAAHLEELEIGIRNVLFVVRSFSVDVLLSLTIH